MGFYIIVLSSFLSLVFSYIMMTSANDRSPENWGERMYPKTKLTLYLIKKREKSKFLAPLKIGIFHLLGFYVSLGSFVVFLLLMVIDLIFNQNLYKFLGFLNTVIIIVFIILLPVFYEVFLAIWWAILNRHSPKYQQIKKLQSIQKKRPKTNKREKED